MEILRLALMSVVQSSQFMQASEVPKILGTGAPLVASFRASALVSEGVTNA